MRAAENPNRGLDVEDEACQRWPAERVPGAPDWYDLEFKADVAAELTPTPIVTEGSRGEVKSCCPDYDDRRGRWWIRRENHERLVDDEGVYILAVVERESNDVLRMALTDASTVDNIIGGEWWDAGDGANATEQYRQIPWTTVFRDLHHGGDPV